MKTNFPGTLLLLLACAFAFNSAVSAQGITFTENKGQVTDQYFQPRPDILFTGITGNLAYHLRRDGISYQLTTVDHAIRTVHAITGEELLIPDRVKSYRVDIRWTGCNPEALVEPGEAVPGVKHYYGASYPDGITGIRAFEGVFYRSVYKQIDLHYYEKDGALKYDFLVGAHADFSQIVLEVAGAEKIALQSDGSVLLHTPLGIISEGRPVVFQAGKALKAAWVVKGNQLHYNIPEYNPELPLVIDPATRVWGTYYGGSALEIAYFTTADAMGNAYLTGQTASSANIASSGAHQNVYGTGSSDAFLVKFNSSGIRQWGTYYGGNNTDAGRSITTDAAGNVYLAGQTASAAGIATPGSHQPVYGGNSGDGFLAKFDSNGIRQWATYYGGYQQDNILACVSDLSGNVYVSGEAQSDTGTVIATPGSHQPVHAAPGADAFLVKFNSSGTRLWGTYYGGTAADGAGALGIDGIGNVVMTGSTESAGGTAIATPGSFQPVFAGGTSDAFMVKFDPNGVRQWGSYFGGSVSGQIDNITAVVSDAVGNFYIAGRAETNTGTAIASPGSHQSTFGGGSVDAFLVKFSGNGTRQWGTYYGGTFSDYGYGCALDVNTGNVYLVGQTGSTTANAIATSGSYMTTFGGVWDGFLALFSGSGTRLWGTYYGGTGDDRIFSCAAGQPGYIYLTGQTASPGSAIATIGAHQTVYGGGTDAYLTQFYECIIPGAPAVVTVPAVCYGNSVTLTAGGTGTIGWYDAPAGGNYLGGGSSFTTPPVTGPVTYYAQDSTCAPGSSRSAVAIQVNALPVVIASVAPDTLVCSGTALTFSGSGALSYSWTGGVTDGVPLQVYATQTYYVTGTDSNGCTANDSVHITVQAVAPVSYVQSPALLCLNDAVLTLSPATPPGGTYSGQGVSGNTFDPGVAGTGSFVITYTYTDSIGCGDTSQQLMVVDICNGIVEGNTASEILITPNPGSGLFTLTLKQATDGATYSIYNSAGALCLVADCSAIRNRIDLTALPAGIYLLRVVLGEKTSTLKFIRN